MGQGDGLKGLEKTSGWSRDSGRNGTGIEVEFDEGEKSKRQCKHHCLKNMSFMTLPPWVYSYMSLPGGIICDRKGRYNL